MNQIEKEEAKHQEQDQDTQSHLANQKCKKLEKGYVDIDVDYLDQYELKAGEVIKGLNLDVKVMWLWPFREDYCQAEVGDQFGKILIHIFG